MWEFPSDGSEWGEATVLRAREQHGAEAQRENPGIGGRKVQLYFSFNTMKTQKKENVW